MTLLRLIRKGIDYLKVLKSNKEKKTPVSFSIRKSVYDEARGLKKQFLERFSNSLNISEHIENYIQETIISYMKDCLKNDKLVSFKEFKEKN